MKMWLILIVNLLSTVAIASPPVSPSTEPHSAAMTGAGTAPDGAMPTFAGSADVSSQVAARLLQQFGLVPQDLAKGRSVAESVGFAVYDRRQGRYVRSFNLDRSFNLASTTKLFTMAIVGQQFRGDPLLTSYRGELASILRHSSNRGASLWMLLASDRDHKLRIDVETRRRQIVGNCHGYPPRAPEQMAAEAEAANAFFARHRAVYAMDWTGAQVVDGAGCERAGMWAGHEDRMSPRQYLTVLDALERQDFGGWNAFELMPQMSADGEVIDSNTTAHVGMLKGHLAWKTGTDAAGIKNIAGYVSTRDDPFAYSFVLFVNTGRSPAESGLVNGATLVHRFAAWAASTAREGFVPR